MKYGIFILNNLNIDLTSLNRKRVASENFKSEFKVSIYNLPPILPTLQKILLFDFLFHLWDLTSHAGKRYLVLSSEDVEHLGGTEEVG